MPDVNPEILSWARKTAGLSLEEAARKIEIGDTKFQKAADRLAALEAGEEQPTQRILRNMARKYRRPLIIFYLKVPPERGDRGEDFRRAPGNPDPQYNPTVDALIRDIKGRQNLVRSLLEDQEIKPLPFIGSLKMDDGPPALVSAITDKLSINISDFRNKKSINQAFNYLRSRIEGSGIFVLLAGNLGSHHTNISEDIFRGYAISDPFAPFIVINDNDAHSAWSFTALHEVTHLWLGSTGISGYTYPSNHIESFCNEVAGEILLQEEELINDFPVIDAAAYSDLVREISSFAEERNISRTMVAYRLLRSNMIGEKKWQKLNNQFYEEWQEDRRKSRKRTSEEEGGPNYYIIRRHRLGKALLWLISNALNEGAITYTKASKALGVKPRNVATLLADLSFQGET